MLIELWQTPEKERERREKRGDIELLERATALYFCIDSVPHWDVSSQYASPCHTTEFKYFDQAWW